MEDEISKVLGFKPEHLFHFAVCIGIGFLIGLERQFSKEEEDNEEQFAGVRTFTLISVFGFTSAFLSSILGAWLFGVALTGVLTMVIVSYMRLSVKAGNAGGTSEITTILTFLLGALVFYKFILFALIIMTVMLLLLAFKPTLHRFVEKLNRKELFDIILFVMMSALVIPFLPGNNFGPYGLWNLKEIWKMVVLVSGTSLVGYLIAKVVGSKGTVLAGIIGGLVSSTSVAISFSRRSKDAGSGASAFFYAMGIISACTIMFPRILFEVYVVNRSLAKQLWIPIAVISLVGFGAAYLIYKTKKAKTHTEDPDVKNPLDLSTAIKFALFYAGIQWLVKYFGETFGDKGTYIAGAVSGITDVDAITLSMAKMAGNGNSDLAINTILIAALSNTLVKFIIVLVLGSAEIRKPAILGFAAIFIAGLSFFVFRLFG